MLVLILKTRETQKMTWSGQTTMNRILTMTRLAPMRMEKMMVKRAKIKRS